MVGFVKPIKRMFAVSAQVIRWPGTPVCSPIGHFIRIGDWAYRRLEDMHAEGRLPAQAVIVDASVALGQKTFIRSLRESGVDVILDTKVAELSVIGRCGGTAGRAPWSKGGQPLVERDFGQGTSSELFGEIARAAVSLGVSAVLSPTHLLREGTDDPWLKTDVESVHSLRNALDREGGHGIALDYSLILPHVRLPNADEGAAGFELLRGLPVDNLFVRLAGFGIDSGPFTVRRTFDGITALHSLSLPIVLDCVGGLVGMGAVAFGMVGGIAHGIGERDRFNARDWDRQPRARASGKGGRTVLLPVPGMDRSFRRKDFDAIIGVRGGRRLVACGDRKCCPQGLASMLADPRPHIARQRLRAMDELAAVPDSRRAKHYVDVDVRTAERKARDLSRLKTGMPSVDKALAQSRKHMDRMSKVYETLAEGVRPTPLPPTRGRAETARSRGSGA